MAAEKKIACTVAPRRTVHADGKAHGPGAILHFASDEAARMTRLGFFVDPGATPEPAPSEGPSFLREGEAG